MLASSEAQVLPPVCRYFLQGGCHFGERCRFHHPMWQDDGRLPAEEYVWGANSWEAAVTGFVAPGATPLQRSALIPSSTEFFPSIGASGEFPELGAAPGQRSPRSKKEAPSRSKR